MNEQRHHRRIPVNIPADIYLGQNPRAIPAEVKNISLGGAFIEASRVIEVGCEVRVEIRFDEIILLQGKVISENELDAKFPELEKQASVVKWAEGGNPNSFGVEFAQLDDQKQAFLLKLIRYYDLLMKAGVRF